jgi:hypothetical protein
MQRRRKLVVEALEHVMVLTVVGVQIRISALSIEAFGVGARRVCGGQGGDVPAHGSRNS